MRRALAITVLALAVWAVPALAAASSTQTNPTKAQIAKAIKQAEASKSLWATINICDTKHHPGEVGIRGQMPTLGFAAWLSMKVKLYRWSTPDKKYELDSTSLVRLGRFSHGLQQGGWSFTFSPHAGLFDADVQFIWRRSGQLLGQKMLPTTAGHPSEDFGDPAHYSAARCRIT